MTWYNSIIRCLYNFHICNYNFIYITWHWIVLCSRGFPIRITFYLPNNVNLSNINEPLIYSVVHSDELLKLPWEINNQLFWIFVKIPFTTSGYTRCWMLIHFFTIFSDFWISEIILSNFSSYYYNQLQPFNLYSNMQTFPLGRLIQTNFLSEHQKLNECW